MKAPVEDGTARIVWVPSQQEWAATGYDGQPIGLFPTQMAAAKAIGGGFPDVLRAALMDEADAASRRTVHVAVPARFRAGPMGGAMADAAVLKAVAVAPPAPAEPAPIAPLPPPDPEPETAVGGGEAVAEPKALPVVHVSAGHIAEGRRRTATPAEVKAFVEQLHHPAAEPAAAPAFAADGLHLNDAGYKRLADEVEKAGAGPATPGYVEYWHARDGWRWYMVVLDHQGGPFPTFDEAVADRWRYA